MATQGQAPLRQGQFNTLAQIGTGTFAKKPERPAIKVHGEGTDLLNKEGIFRRTKRKQISQVLSLDFMRMAERRCNDVLAKTFRNTYYCLETVHVSGTRMYGRYCKNRICAVCCSIRKAEMINAYLPIIKEWEDPHFVTLTVKSVPAIRLKPLIHNIKMGLRQILNKYKKQEQRGTGKKLIGLYSLECNFNPTKRTYNPHFHIVVANREMGETLIREWLAYSRKKGDRGLTSPDAQDIRPVGKGENILIEIVKYGTKIFTELDPRKKTKKPKDGKVYVKAIYTIIAAMQGVRIFERFGFNLPKRDKSKSEPSTLLRYDEYAYSPENRNWMDTDSNIPLSDYVPDAEVCFLLENRIDLENN